MAEQFYRVLVDDNFHYMDEDERYPSGRFASYADAVEHCEYIVDRYLTGAYVDGMTAETLYEAYKNFGEDPFIRVEGSAPEPPTHFSAWGYAKQRCEEITGTQIA